LNFQTKPRKSKTKPADPPQEDQGSTDYSEIDDVEMEEASQIGEKRPRGKEPTPDEAKIRKKRKSNTSEARA
jgi:hypothetical protein